MKQDRTGTDGGVDKAHPRTVQPSEAGTRTVTNVLLVLLTLFMTAPWEASAAELLWDAVACAGGSVSKADSTLSFSAGLPGCGVVHAVGFEIIVGFWCPNVTPTVGVGPDPGPGNIPLVTRLNQNRPNPFNPSTTIAFELAGPRGSTIATTLRIYDITGRRVTELVNGPAPPGKHEVVWDGRDARNRPVASGVYFARLTAGQESFTIRLVAMK